MGYAKLTARKEVLQARVNSLNSELMQISNQQNALTNQISQNQNMANMRSAYNQLQASSLFSSNVNGGMEYSQAMLQYQNSMAENTLTSTTNNLSLSATQSQENALDTRREQVQTKLTAATNELENVKKAEEQGIKNSTVKYNA